MPFRLVCGIICYLGWACHSAVAAAQPHPSIWFAPMQPSLRPDGTEAGAIDYFDLFAASAPWEVAAQHVSVFKIYAALLQNAADDQIRRLVAGLAERHIALGLEAPVLVEPNRCDSGTEATFWVVGLVARLKRLGGNLKSFAMVGPLIDGHTSPRPNACHRSIPEVAAEAARVTAALRQFYPGLEVGEIEPLGQGSNYPNWHELGAWFDAWRKASGRPIAFLHIDTGWGTRWQDDMRDVAKQTRAAGVRFGVIYNGSPSDLSDEAFTSDALEHADELESALSGAPDDVILQSWEDYPRHALPDTAAGTMTGLVRAYVRSSTHLVRLAQNRVRLVRDGGTAVESAELNLEVHDPVPGQTLQPLTIEGIAPHAAVSALVALRVHTECNCSQQAANLSIAGYEFHQENPGRNFRGDFSAWSSPPTAKVQFLATTGVPVLEINVESGRPWMLNGPTFAVVADQAFRLTVPFQVEPQSQGTGFVAVVFKDQRDKEVRRAFAWFSTSWREIARLRTSADGGVKLPPLPVASADTFRVRFAGDLDNRPSVLSIAR